MLPQTAWLVFVSAAPVSITAFKQFEVDDFPFRAAPPRALRAEVGNRDRCPFESASVLPIQVLEAAVPSYSTRTSVAKRPARSCHNFAHTIILTATDLDMDQIWSRKESEPAVAESCDFSNVVSERDFVLGLSPRMELGA